MMRRVSDTRVRLSEKRLGLGQKVTRRVRVHEAVAILA